MEGGGGEIFPKIDGLPNLWIYDTYNKMKIIKGLEFTSNFLHITPMVRPILSKIRAVKKGFKMLKIKKKMYTYTILKRKNKCKRLVIIEIILPSTLIPIICYKVLGNSYDAMYRLLKKLY